MTHVDLIEKLLTYNTLEKVTPQEFEKIQQERDQQQRRQDNKSQDNAELTEIDDASDLFRQHSHQQSMEGG